MSIPYQHGTALSQRCADENTPARRCVSSVSRPPIRGPEKPVVPPAWNSYAYGTSSLGVLTQTPGPGKGEYVRSPPRPTAPSASGYQSPLNSSTPNYLGGIRLRIAACRGGSYLDKHLEGMKK